MFNCSRPGPSGLAFKYFYNWCQNTGYFVYQTYTECVSYLNDMSEPVREFLLLKCKQASYNKMCCFKPQNRFALTF